MLKSQTVTKANQKSPDFSKVLPWLFVILGLVAVIASLLLSLETYNRLKNPGYVPACSLNPIISCTSIANSSQSHVLGIPNYYLGIAAYSAVVTIGLAMLGGTKLKRWFWQAVQAGMTLAFIFITWLQFQSLYRIGALCLFCMIVWAMTGPLFWYTTLYNLNEGHIKTPSRLKGAVTFVNAYHAYILLAWFLLIIGLILERFWYYWSFLA